MKTILLVVLAMSVSSSLSWANDSFFASKMAVYSLMKNQELSPAALPTVTHQTISSMNDFDLVSVRLAYKDQPEIRFVMRGPRGFLQQHDNSFQTIFLASGFFTGSESVHFLGHIDKTVVVGFEYPYSVEDMTRDPGKVLQTFRVTAGQMALTLKWLAQQEWNAAYKMVAMGVSLGGIFMPAALHIAQEMNVSIGRTIFAFTGADIEVSLRNVSRKHLTQPVAEAMTWLLPKINIVNDPQLHLPQLKGQFLVIYSQDDQTIPPSTSQKLFDLLAPPKKMILLQGPHIDVTQPDQINKTREAVLSWL